MNVLAIEAGGAQFGLSCVRAELDSDETAFETRAVFASSEARSLSRDLVIQIDAVLSRANWTTENLDVIAVGIGPGSWTSLRIALSTAKTLAQICGCEICGVPSFAAWARAANSCVANDRAFDTTENSFILVTAPCRPDAIYGQIMDIEYSMCGIADVKATGAEEVAAPPAWASRVAILNHEKLPVTVCGEARAAVFSELLNVQQNARETNVSVESVAVAIAQLGATQLTRGESDDAMALQPLYIGVSNAERVANERLADKRVADELNQEQNRALPTSTR